MIDKDKPTLRGALPPLEMHLADAINKMARAIFQLGAHMEDLANSIHESAGELNSAINSLAKSVYYKQEGDDV
tara:strand:+ start:389 stop:607 length:219 start_codon:yes stop_codon:yes gene_type:complete